MIKLQNPNSHQKLFFDLLEEPKRQRLPNRLGGNHTIHYPVIDKEIERVPINSKREAVIPRGDLRQTLKGNALKIAAER